MTTHSNPEVGTSDQVDTPRERENAPGAPQSRKSEDTHSHILQRARTYFTPPSVLTDAPESIPDKRRYAREGDWTASENGPIRKLGVGYWRLIALPVSVVADYVKWIADRPGRAVIVFTLWKLLILNDPGPWVVRHVFAPVGNLLAWLFL